MASKTILVAQREYMENVRTKTFWLGILAFPAIFAIAIGIGWIMEKTKARQEYAVLDYTAAQLAQRIEEVARAADLERYLGELMGSGAKDFPTALAAAKAKVPADSPLQGLLEVLAQTPPEEIAALQAAAAQGKRPAPSAAMMARFFRWASSLGPDQVKNLALLGSAQKYRLRPLADLQVADLPRAQQEQQLREKVQKGELFAYFVFDGDPVQKADGLTYVSNNLTDDGLRDWYARAATTVVRKLRVEAAAIEPAVAAHIQESIAFAAKQVDAKTGTVEDVKKEDKANRFAPVVFVYLLWIAVFTAAQMLLTNTVEEKSNRIIEVLLSSVSPGELMAGKIWGIGATGLTIVGSWAVCGLIGVDIGGRLVPQFAELNLGAIVGDPLYLASFLGYFLTGYLLFAAMLVAIGSVCNSLKEAQNLLQPVFLLLMLPLFAMVPIVQEPNGLMARVFTYIPLYTPFAMMNRASGPPPAWEYAVTTVIILVSVVFAFKAAGRIFRIGVLMTGNPPRLKEVLGWLRRG